jgi:hypothetical protein
VILWEWSTIHPVHGIVGYITHTYFPPLSGNSLLHEVVKLHTLNILTHAQVQMNESGCGRVLGSLTSSDDVISITRMADNRFSSQF